MELEKKIDLCIREEQLIGNKNEKVLLAISGGRDSVCLMYALFSLGYTIGLVHVNHKLRAEEADADENFVRELGQHFQIPFYSKSADVKALAKAKKENLHQAAREIRYNFFQEIALKFGYSKIATAHHLDDQIESFLFHFSRGSGIRGLSGIPVKRDNIIRPLINCSRLEIDAYINEHDLEFREDHSNVKTNYSRNFIRHEIIPLLSKVHPGFTSNAQHSLDLMRKTRMFYDSQMERITKGLITEDGPYFIIDQSAIYKEFHGKLILYEILQSFGFNKDQASQIFEDKSGNGQLFFSPVYELLSDRERWIIRKKVTSAKEVHSISDQGAEIPGIGNFRILFFEKSPSELHTRFTAYTDADKIKFPLKLRNWQPGDYFYPLNMEGKKQKLKHFFVNEKLNRFEKENVLIIESGGDVVWLIGHRMDDRFKLTEKTKRICSIQFEPESDTL